MNKQNNTQPNDYVTQSEFKDFAHKNELAHEKISGEISDLRKDIEVQNTKIDAQNVKIDAFTDKISSDISLLRKDLDSNVALLRKDMDSNVSLLRKDIKNQNNKVDKEVSSAMCKQIIWLSTVLIGFLGLFMFIR